MNMEDRLSDTDDYRRDHFVRIIERAVEKMTLKELEAVAYDLFTKGYLEGLLILQVAPAIPCS